jgi:hypothetical protein
MLGASVDAADGPLATVDDFVVEDQPARPGAWEVQYLVLELRGWFQHKRVLLSPEWALTADWKGRRVEVGLPASQIRESPEFDPSEPVNRETEQRLYDYYGLPKSWA